MEERGESAQLLDTASSKASPVDDPHQPKENASEDGVKDASIQDRWLSMLTRPDTRFYAGWPIQSRIRRDPLSYDRTRRLYHLRQQQQQSDAPVLPPSELASLSMMGVLGSGLYAGNVTLRRDKERADVALACDMGARMRWRSLTPFTPLHGLMDVKDVMMRPSHGARLIDAKQALLPSPSLPAQMKYVREMCPDAHIPGELLRGLLEDEADSASSAAVASRRLEGQHMVLVPVPLPELNRTVTFVICSAGYANHCLCATRLLDYGVDEASVEERSMSLPLFGLDLADSAIRHRFSLSIVAISLSPSRSHLVVRLFGGGLRIFAVPKQMPEWRQPWQPFTGPEDPLTDDGTPQSPFLGPILTIAWNTCSVQDELWALTRDFSLLAWRPHSTDAAASSWTKMTQLHFLTRLGTRPEDVLHLCMAHHPLALLISLSNVIYLIDVRDAQDEGYDPMPLHDTRSFGYTQGVLGLDKPPSHRYWYMMADRSTLYLKDVRCSHLPHLSLLTLSHTLGTSPGRIHLSLTPLPTPTSAELYVWMAWRSDTKKVLWVTIQVTSDGLHLVDLPYAPTTSLSCIKGLHGTPPALRPYANKTGEPAALAVHHPVSHPLTAVHLFPLNGITYLFQLYADGTLWYQGYQLGPRNDVSVERRLALAQKEAKLPGSLVASTLTLTALKQILPPRPISFLFPLLQDPHLTYLATAPTAAQPLTVRSARYAPTLTTRQQRRLKRDPEHTPILVPMSYLYQKCVRYLLYPPDLYALRHHAAAMRDHLFALLDAPALLVPLIRDTSHGWQARHLVVKAILRHWKQVICQDPRLYFKKAKKSYITLQLQLLPFVSSLLYPALTATSLADTEDPASDAARPWLCVPWSTLGHFGHLLECAALQPAPLRKEPELLAEHHSSLSSDVDIPLSDTTEASSSRVTVSEMDSIDLASHSTRKPVTGTDEESDSGAMVENASEKSYVSDNQNHSDDSVEEEDDFVIFPPNQVMQDATPAVSSESEHDASIPPVMPILANDAPFTPLEERRAVRRQLARLLFPDAPDAQHALYTFPHLERCAHATSTTSGLRRLVHDLTLAGHLRPTSPLPSLPNGRLGDGWRTMEAASVSTAYKLKQPVIFTPYDRHTSALLDGPFAGTPMPSETGAWSSSQYGTPFTGSISPFYHNLVGVSPYAAKTPPYPAKIPSSAHQSPAPSSTWLPSSQTEPIPSIPRVSIGGEIHASVRAPPSSSQREMGSQAAPQSTRVSSVLASSQIPASQSGAPSQGPVKKRRTGGF